MKQGSGAAFVNFLKENNRMKRMNPKRYGVLIILMVGCLGMLINRAEAAQTKAAQPKVSQAKASGMGFSLKVSGGMGFFLDGGATSRTSGWLKSTSTRI